MDYYIHDNIVKKITISSKTSLFIIQIIFGGSQYGKRNYRQR